MYTQILASFFDLSLGLYKCPAFPPCEHPAQLLLPTQFFSPQVDRGSVRTVVKPCSLDPATQKLITNIFSKEMFKNAMTLMNLGEEELWGEWQGPDIRGCRTETIPSSPRCEEDALGKAEQAADCTGL